MTVMRDPEVMAALERLNDAMERFTGLPNPATEPVARRNGVLAYMMGVQLEMMGIVSAVLAIDEWTRYVESLHGAKLSESGNAA